MNKLAKLSLKALGGATGTFLLLFTVYFFNLDEKFMAYCVDPILQAVYNRRKPNYYV